MLSFIAPMWLLGLLLLPVIRWLHRGGRHRRAVPVSHLGLWRGATASSPAAGERRPPDPAWRRRALFTALLFAALTQPQLPAQRVRITLWVDDSISMLTREAQGTRLAVGLAQARALLAEAGPAEVELRTLGDPWRSLGMPTDAVVATLTANVVMASAATAHAGAKAPAGPPAALLHRDSQHWLVTDGTKPAAFDWPGGRRPDRTIQVAAVTRNVGLERLSARRNGGDPDQVDLLLKVTNGGTAAEAREVVFTTDTAEVARTTQRLEAGASVLVNAVVPASTTVRARLQPGDALAEDDQIVLDLTPLRRRRVAIDATCAGALVAAVGAHPALVVAQDKAADVQAVLDCGARGAAPGMATIRVLADRAPTPPPGSVQWSSAVAEPRRVRLDTEQLRLAARLAVQPADAVLLAVGDEPVIVDRAGPSKLLETSLDFASPDSVRGAQIPLLVNLLFERLLAVNLLDGTAMTDRGPGSARVAPAVRAQADAGAAVPGASRLLRDGARPLLVVALLALLWEILALCAQCYRWAGRSKAMPG